MEIIETEDLFRGASLLCLGAELTQIHRKGHSVQFTLQGQQLNRLDMNYRTGKALVNPLELKEHLNILRDLIFERPGNRSPEIVREAHAPHR